MGSRHGGEANPKLHTRKIIAGVAVIVGAGQRDGNSRGDHSQIVNPHQGFIWDAINYDTALANLAVDAWYNPPLNIYENQLLRVLSEQYRTADEGTDQTLSRLPGGGIPHPKYGERIKWYLRTEPNRPQDIGQYVTVIRYTADDIARSSIDAGCGTPQIPVPDSNPGRYQSSKLGTPETAGPSGVDAGAPLIVWSQHSDFYAGNPDRPAWEPRWYFADQTLSAPNFGEDETLSNYEIPENQQSKPDPQVIPRVGDTVWLHGQRVEVETATVGADGYVTHINGRPVVRLEDHEMVKANIVVYDKSDGICPDWLLEDLPPGDTAHPLCPDTIPAGKNCLPIVDCSAPGWYCLAAQQRGWGIDQFDWLLPRDLRIGFQYYLPDWQQYVSTLEHPTENQRGIILEPTSPVVTLSSHPRR